MSKVYFSCPKFTVLLVTRGSIIVKAAPIVKRFEGQTIGALTSWARSRFGGPIVVEKLPQAPRSREPQDRKPPLKEGLCSKYPGNRVEGGPTGVHPVSDKYSSQWHRVLPNTESEARA
jgi:hypothetical protein